MVLHPEDRIHVITRRNFDGDLRRHFAGVVQQSSETVVKSEGFSFFFDPNKNSFARRPNKRVRIFSLVDANNIIHQLPRSISLEKLSYTLSSGNRLVLTDGSSFEMDINEFSHLR